MDEGRCILIFAAPIERRTLRLKRIGQSSSQRHNLRLPGVFRRIRRNEYRRAVRMHYGPTRIHQAGYSPRHRRDGIAGTTIIYHLRIYRWTLSLSVMTTGRLGLLEHGHRRRIRQGRRTFQGLRAGRRSGHRRRTNNCYCAGDNETVEHHSREKEDPVHICYTKYICFSNVSLCRY
jgi:hypothetical protein